MGPIMVLPRHPHIEISTWLEMLELPQYNGNYLQWKKKKNHSKSILHFPNSTESFTKFIGVEELMYFCEADIKQLGVRNSAHRARIVSSLVAFRDKYEHGKLNKKSPLSHLHVFKSQLYTLRFFFLHIESWFLFQAIVSRLCVGIWFDLATHTQNVICESAHLEVVC